MSSDEEIYCNPDENWIFGRGGGYPAHCHREVRDGHGGRRGIFFDGVYGNIPNASRKILITPERFQIQYPGEVSLFPMSTGFDMLCALASMDHLLSIF